MNSGSQGLETLAALCGGVTRPSTQHSLNLDSYLSSTTAEAIAPGMPIHHNTTSHEQQPCATVNDAMLSPNVAGQQWLQYLATINGAQPPEASLPGVSFPTAAACQSGVVAPNNLAAAFCQWMYNIQGQYQPLVHAVQASQLAQQFYQQQHHQMPTALPSVGTATVPTTDNLVVSSSISKPSDGSTHSASGFHHLSNREQQTDTSFQEGSVVSSVQEPQGCVVKKSTSHSDFTTMAASVVSVAPSVQLSIAQPDQNLEAYAGEIVNLNTSSSTNPKNFVTFTKLPEKIHSKDPPMEQLDASTIVEKKELKRAANRRSAQLSRKRKKHFVEELKEENDDLRRKEQILRSVPDLIVMFDSAGRLGFVSHSVSNFVDFKPSELEGTSFWHRLCDESVRLLKAAFMDALASRLPEMDTTPLGEGLWELRLKDKDGSERLVTLNGVVHFSGDRPECVCSIRLKATPREEIVAQQKMPKYLAPSADKKCDTIQIKSEQSVVVDPTEYPSHLKTILNNACTHHRRVAPISDGESNSESGSDRF